MRRVEEVEPPEINGPEHKPVVGMDRVGRLRILVDAHPFGDIGKGRAVHDAWARVCLKDPHLVRAANPRDESATQVGLRLPMRVVNLASH